MLVQEWTSGQLKVEVYASRAALGRAAAKGVAARMREALSEKERVSMVFAAAPSQNEFLAALRETADLDWSRVTAFHMDEYVGLSADAPQSFRKFLDDHLFGAVQPGVIHYLAGDAPDPEGECRRYAALLAAQPPAIVCAGIGENGHLAFNDPHIADFDDPLLVKVVELDAASRQQQVNDDCFEKLEDVPTHALTVTIPALTRARHLSVVVPGTAKAEAVEATLHAPVSPAYPATILRRHAGAVLLLDVDAATRLNLAQGQQPGAVAD